MIDLPPPVDLWLPPKPAIIRPISEWRENPIGLSLVFPTTLIAGGGPTSFTLGVEGNGNGATKTIPALGAAGDLCVLLDTAINSTGGGLPSEVIPTGFTEFLSVDGAERAIGRVSAKVLQSGDPGANVTGLSGTSASRWVMACFRPDVAIVSWTGTQTGSEGTAGDPAVQTIDATGESVPVILLALLYASTTIDTETSSPAMTGFTTSGTTQVAYHQLYNSGDTIQSHTVDMGDEGTENIMVSGYISFP